MKILRALSLLLSFFLIYSFSYGQGQRAYGDFSSSSNKKTEKTILKSARKQFDLGNYAEAQQKYWDLLKLDSANPMYNLEQAQSLFNNFRQPASIPYFEKAINYSKDTLGEAYYFLASAYHLDGKFDLAKKNYKTYLSILDEFGTDLLEEEEADLKNDIKHKIEMCDNGKILAQSPVSKITINGKTHSFEITNVGNDVNSEYDDYDAVLSANDSVMYFTSRRDSTTGGKLDWDDKYFEDIYVSGLGKKGWGKSFGIGDPVNTDKHEAMISISADGKTIYFYRGVKQGTFYSSNLLGGAWSKPTILYEKSDVNTKAWETSFFGFLVSGNELYVVSDREGGAGGRDIFVSLKQPDGTWGPLNDMGAPINTEYDEDAPYITADGKTMYFSSTGHNSMGGFDIFKSEKAGDKWSEPVNLGVPINTPGDDIYFLLANKSDRAFYSSSSQAADGTKDMDVYMIDLCDDIPTTTINGLAMGVSKGTILISEKESGKEVGSCEIKNGKYSVKIEHGKNYLFTLRTSGLEPVSAEVRVPKQCRQYDLYQELNFTQPGQPLVFKNAFFDIKNIAGSMNYSEFLAKADKSKLPGYNEVSVTTNAVMVVMVDTIKKVTTTADTSGKTKTDTTTTIKTTISFNNVLFDFNKSNLKKEFLPELDKAVALLKKDYPKVKFEVAGHTDSKGKDSYNMNLSNLRASAVANYLVSKGIKRSRMKVVGYGASKPIAPNTNADGSDNEDGRAKNRRTEIVIIR
ncbi:MAG: OmpA family protein [Bacteroidetes bacterium]|nr:OmpA family protein [Bacteroidota bacterium]